MPGRLLKKQVKKYLQSFTQDQIDRDLWEFLRVVERTYRDFDDGRKLMERSLDISSHELMWINKKMWENIAEKEELLNDLLDSVKRLEGTRKNTLSRDIWVKDLSWYLKKLITQNISNTKQIAQKEKRLATIVDSVGEWLLVVDKKWKILICNEVANQILWMPDEEVLWYHYQKIHFIYPHNKRVYFDFIEQSMDKNQSITILDNIDVQNKEMDIPVSVIVSPIEWDIKWKNVWCVIVLRNMTEARRIENMKNEFLSIASHELRTPMTVINGYISILLKQKLGPLNEKQQRYLDRSQNNINDLLSLVNDMLDVSKLESGKLELHYSCFDINELIHEIKDDFSELVEWKNIKLCVSGEAIDICSDRDKLKQVIINLLGNAYKFTPEWGNINLKLKKNNDYCLISVQDSWIWIDKANIKKLFQKFSQIDSHLERTEKWTGLGLIICKLIIEQLGWNIDVTSELWAGSNFYFEIPIKNDILDA